jgi:hypothetical protein
MKRHEIIFNPDTAIPFFELQYLGDKGEYFLGQYLRGKISRDEAIESIGIDWVELTERQHEASMENLAWALKK